MLVSNPTCVASEYGVFDVICTRIDRKTSLLSGFMAAKVFIIIDVLFCEIHLVTFESHNVYYGSKWIIQFQSSKLQIPV